MMVGAETIRDLNALLAERASSFVSKPVNFYEFAEAVQRLGCYWLFLNQLPED